MPEIEHIEVAGGNVPPMIKTLKDTKLFAVTKKGGGSVYNYVLKFSLDDLFELSMAVNTPGLSIEFEPILDDQGNIKYEVKRPIVVTDNLGNTSVNKDAKFIGATIKR